MSKPPKPEDQPANPQTKTKGGSPVKKAIDALARLIGTKITTPEHIDAYFKEISGVGSDRGMGIIMVTTVEDALQAAIESRLSINEGQRQILFGADGPIGTFANTPAIKTACDLLDMPLIRTPSDGVQPRWSVQIIGYKGRPRFQMVCHSLAQNFASFAHLSNQRPPPGRPDNRYEAVVRPKPLH